MTATPPIPSVASAGSTLGLVGADHFRITLANILHGPDFLVEDGFIALASGIPHPLANIVAFADDVSEETAARAMGTLSSCDAPAAVIHRVSGVDATVEAVVAAAGFDALAPMPVMAVDIDRLAATSLPDDCTFMRVTAEDMGAGWNEALAAGYPIPLELAERFGPVLSHADPAPDASLQFYGVERGGRVVATSMVYLNAGVAGVYCVATVPEERGRGIGAHVTAEPLRRVQRLGYRVGVLQSSEEGEAVYRRLGFGEHARLFLGVRMPAS